MDLFIPYITVQPASPVNDSIETKQNYNTMAVPQNSEFQKYILKSLQENAMKKTATLMQYQIWRVFIMKNITGQALHL